MQTRSSETLLRRKFLLGTLGGTTLGLVALAPRRAAAADVTLLETGSSLLYPLFNLWVPKYTAMHPGLRITTQSTGSGTGIAQAVSGVAQIGASDAYMSSPQLKKSPGILNIPLAISAQTVNYNVPGLNDAGIKLSGPVLAAIYSGKITHWNDPAIAKINPGVSLPNHGITPIHRTDGSGDTFIFTQYLSFSTPEWANSVAYGTTISWPPVQGGIGAIGNPGMVQACGQTPYSIAYIGVSFHAQIAKAGLGTALLQNRDGNFVLPNPATVGAAASALEAKTPPDQRISLIFAPGASSYPIINYEYAIVNSRQASPVIAAALRDFLTWAVDPSGGNAPEFLNVVEFLPLPDKIAALSKAQIAKIR
jgi:phosphate transport system substrate-binding protein